MSGLYLYSPTRLHDMQQVQFTLSYLTYTVKTAEKSKQYFHAAGVCLTTFMKLLAATPFHQFLFLSTFPFT
jgi:hypothetical protein